jgi:hypothetical protein
MSLKTGVVKSSRYLAYASMAIFLAATFWLAAHARPVNSGLTVHEWGTFTSVAGKDGQSVEWSRLTGPSDLPSFVEHFRDAAFKLGLRGSVRMETPVLYFYSPDEQTVSLHISFRNGVITEWYPRASRVEPEKALYDASLTHDHLDGGIAWDSVTVSPYLRGDFPDENRASHYYAARQTTSTPLRVRTAQGEQREKFLFYRGVAAFPVPIDASIESNGAIRVENRLPPEIPNVILFERRGENVGYRIAGALASSPLELNPLELTGSLTLLAQDLEGILVAQGLYQNEAHAMVDTWRDSWFEEGSRLLYIVPEKFVTSVLPLTVIPAPEQTTRVFVGRLELVTPATQRAVERAFATHDDTTLRKYGRFLEPILQTMIQQSQDRAQISALHHDLEVVNMSLIVRNTQRN